ncbi:MAG: DedA family protein [Treponemataceae bacterium]
MSAITDFFLTSLSAYGTPLFTLALFLGAAGFPVPASLLVVAAGAFARQGLLDPALTALFGLLGAVAGDSVSFAFGRWGGALISRRFDSQSAWVKTRTVFDRNSRLAVFLTRFLITPAAFPVNLMAGVGCKYFRFFFTILLGQSIWIVVYGGLGYLFGSQWELISQFLSDLGGFALGIATLAIAVIISHRFFARKNAHEGNQQR